MASHVLLDENLGALNNTRADNEERSINLLLSQEVEEVLSVIRRTIIEAEDKEKLIQRWTQKKYTTATYLTPQSYFVGQATISVGRVYPPQVHQPRLAASAA